MYELSALTAASISLRGVYVNCMHPEVTILPPDAGGRSIRVRNKNQYHQLILLSLLAHDKAFDVLINCDPQMTNTPET